MDWLILTILAIFSRAVYGVSTKVLSSDVKTSPATQSVLFSGFATAIAVMINPLLGGLDISGLLSNLWMVLITICAMSFGNVLYYIGIKKLDSSTTQIAFSSILIWGVIFSMFFLKSHFSLLQALGISMLALAIFIVQYKKGEYKLSSGFVYIVVSASIFAIAQITSAYLSRSLNTATYLIAIFLGQTIVVWLIYFKKVSAEIKSIKSNIYKSTSAIFFSSITSTIFMVSSYFAFKHAPDSGVVVVLLTSQVIFAVILSIIFLKEKDHIKRKIIAGILAVIAGILIKG